MARAFPKGARVRTTVVLVICGLLLAGLSPATAEVPAKHGDHKSGGLKHKKHQVEKKIRGAHEDLDESSSQLRHAAAVLDAARARLRAARSRRSATPPDRWPICSRTAARTSGLQGEPFI